MNLGFITGLSIALIPLLTGASWAAFLSQELARQVAEGFLRQQGREATLRGVVPGPACCHVLELEPAGFVVVAADRQLPPVLAYSWTAGFGAADPGRNPLLALLETDLAARLEHLDVLTPALREERGLAWEALLERPTRMSGEREEVWPPEGSTSTGGWVETQWGQGPPWNDDCPQDGGGVRGLAGCPAVTMAQILAYHRELGDTRFTVQDRYYHNYPSGVYWIDDAWESRGFPSFPQLNSALDSLASHWNVGQEASDSDQAALVFACGVASTQVFSPQGSGTFGVDQAFAAWQRFGCTSARLLDEDEGGEVYAALEANMRAGQPAHLAVVTPSWNAGHNLVVDGWNGDGYFHLNFGWEGAYDSWYLLPRELPFNLTVLEGVIVDIQPVQSGLPAPERPLAGMELRGWPNPCNPKLSLECRLERAEAVRVEIFDLAGRQVALLHEGRLPAGSHRLDWRPRGASGLYLARVRGLESGEVATTRVLVVR